MVTVYVRGRWSGDLGRVMFQRMAHAMNTTDSHHDFSLGGRRYRWAEGVLHPAAARFRGRRAELASMLTRTVTPALLRRGATRSQLAATSDGHAWWVLWRREGDAPVWALYVSTRGLPRAATRTRGTPANDGALLAAWGDGPVLAWAHEAPALQAKLREALRNVPGFLSEGVCSADATFAVRVTAA